MMRYASEEPTDRRAVAPARTKKPRRRGVRRSVMRSARKPQNAEMLLVKDVFQKSM